MNDSKVCPRCRKEYSDPDLRFCPSDGSALFSAEVIQYVGQQLDERYQITDVMTLGSWSVVYRGRHLKLEKDVALKVLPEKHSNNPRRVERFMQEARTASLIRHPNIVDVIDFGKSQSGLVFLVQEYLDGMSLGEAMEQQSPFSVFRSVNIMTQLAKALGAAHEADIVHLNIRPENIFLLEERGRRKVVRVMEWEGEKRYVVESEYSYDFVKLLGFAGAKFVDDEVTHTVSPVKVSRREVTQYTPPEQVAGKALDLRSDIYSLGILFYRMVTGLMPFDGPPVPGATVVPPGWRVPELKLDNGTNRTVMRCLESDPAARYQSMDELLEALRGCFTDRVFLRDAARMPGAVEAGIVPQEPPPEVRELRLQEQHERQQPLPENAKSRLTDELKELFAGRDEGLEGPGS
jgi:serine/threonine-protein kinase